MDITFLEGQSPTAQRANGEAQPGHAELKSTKENAGGARVGAKGLGLGSDVPDAHVSSGTGAEGSTPMRLYASSGC